jgi:hypothetical protein
LENQVAIQLRRIYGDDLFYYHHGVEVDFYVSEVQMAVQVCYSLQDIETHYREVNALIKMSKQIKVKKMIILTKDEEETISKQGMTIQVVPVWKWLLNP